MESHITQQTKNLGNNKFTRDTPFKILLSDLWQFKLTLKGWDLFINENYFLANVLYLVKTPHVDSSIMGNTLISIIERIISSHRNSRGRPCKSNCCGFRCWTTWRFLISFWSNICYILLSWIKNDPKQTLKIKKFFITLSEKLKKKFRCNFVIPPVLELHCDKFSPNCCWPDEMYTIHIKFGGGFYMFKSFLKIL